MASLLTLFAAALLLGLQPPVESSPADATPITFHGPVTQLDEVTVIGRRLRDSVSEFVQTVAAPSSGADGLGVWRGGVCVGVVGMRPDAARFMADRVSGIAGELEIAVGRPGCRPNILITASEDGDAMASELVASRRRDFRTGVGSADAGAAALHRFQTSGDLVRWWHVTLPVDARSGRPTVRLPGQEPFKSQGDRTRVQDFGPYGSLAYASSLRRNTRDELYQAIVIIDIDALDVADFGQISDYVAVVALATIDANADWRGSGSILSLFHDPDAAPSRLTDWDWAYLQALYRADQDRLTRQGNVAAVADQMVRVLEHRADSGEE